MLVLSRKSQERIHIGDQITLTVIRINKNSVRIGIEAPRDIRALRGELSGLALEDAPDEFAETLPSPDEEIFRAVAPR